MTAFVALPSKTAEPAGPGSTGASLRAAGKPGDEPTRKAPGAFSGVLSKAMENADPEDDTKHDSSGGPGYGAATASALAAMLATPPVRTPAAPVCLPEELSAECRSATPPGETVVAGVFENLPFPIDSAATIDTGLEGAPPALPDSIGQEDAELETGPADLAAEMPDLQDLAELPKRKQELESPKAAGAALQEPAPGASAASSKSSPPSTGTDPGRIPQGNSVFVIPVIREASLEPAPAVRRNNVQGEGSRPELSSLSAEGTQEIGVPEVPSHLNIRVQRAISEGGRNDRFASDLAFRARLIPTPPGDQTHTDIPESSAPPARKNAEPPAEASTAKEPAADDPPVFRKGSDPQVSLVGGEPAPKQASERPSARPVESTAPPAAAEVEEPAPIATPRPVRSIQFQVAAADRKVEVQLSERAGELHVAVRTPDTRLAADLRDQLPALSSKLEAGGFRTETQHSQTGANELRREPETSSISASRKDEPSGKDDRGRQGDAEQRRPEPPEEAPTRRKTKGNEFSWLMSTLR